MVGGGPSYVIISHQLSIASSAGKRGRCHMVSTCPQNTFLNPSVLLDFGSKQMAKTVAWGVVQETQATPQRVNE